MAEVKKSKYPVPEVLAAAAKIKKSRRLDLSKDINWNDRSWPPGPSINWNALTMAAMGRVNFWEIDKDDDLDLL